MAEKTTTLDAVRMHRDNADAIVAAGEVVDLRFKSGNQLSLRAAKLFCLLVQEAGIDVAADKQHRVPLAVLNETFHRSADDLYEAIAELHSTTVSVQVAGDRPYTKSGPILADVERETEETAAAEVRFEFSKTLRQVIGDSTHWAAVSRRAVLSFESKFSLRLYLLLSLRAGLRKTSETFEMDDLRHILGLEDGKFSRWPDLRRFVLDRAVAEINHLAGFRMGHIPIKKGRKITAVKLTWGRKDLPELIEAQKELDRPRVGRTVRREGKTETIADERAALADSLANAPGWNVIKE